MLGRPENFKKDKHTWDFNIGLTLPFSNLLRKLHNRLLILSPLLLQTYALNWTVFCAIPNGLSKRILCQANHRLINFKYLFVDSRCHVCREDPTIFAGWYDTCIIFETLIYLPNTVNMKVLEVLSCRDFLVLAKSLNDLSLGHIPNANDPIASTRVNHWFILTHQKCLHDCTIVSTYQIVYLVSLAWVYHFNWVVGVRCKDQIATLTTRHRRRAGFALVQVKRAS